MILDFGLARTNRPGEARVTRMGAVIGTPSYMAPEQVEGNIEAMGPACDIYSLGIILYELLTGRLPFEGSVAAVLGQIMVTVPPPPSTHRRDLDRNLEAICLKAIAKKPADRHASMSDLAATLTEYLRKDSQPPGAQPAPVAGPASPATDPAARQSTGDQLAAQLFAGIGDSQASATKTKLPKSSRRRLPRWTWIAAGVAAAALLLALGTVIYVSTNKGTIKVELSDPAADVEIKVDGDTISITGLDEPLKLKAGDHELVVTGKKFETVSKSFTVKRGDNPVLRITLQEKKQAAASDRWVSIMPTEAELAPEDGASYRDGVLTIRPKGRGFGSGLVKAKNASIRAVVKRLNGQHMELNLRWGQEGQRYHAVFDGRGFGVYKWVKDDAELKRITLQEKPSPKVFDDFFEFAFKVDDELLTVEADGVEVLRVRDFTLNEAGPMSFLCYKCAALVKKVEVKILDKPETHEQSNAQAPPTNLPADGWISIMPTQEEVSRTSFAKYENGVLRLQVDRAAISSGKSQAAFSSDKHRARNAIIRVVVKKLEGQDVFLNLREKRGETYGGFYSGGRTFGIGKNVRANGKDQWAQLATGRSSKPYSDFFEFAFKAEDDLLTIEADGEEVVRVLDTTHDRAGALTFGAFQGEGLFKKAEIKILDGVAQKVDKKEKHPSDPDIPNTLVPPKRGVAQKVPKKDTPSVTESDPDLRLALEHEKKLAQELAKQKKKNEMLAASVRRTAALDAELEALKTAGEQMKSDTTGNTFTAKREDETTSAGTRAKTRLAELKRRQKEEEEAASQAAMNSIHPETPRNRIKKILPNSPYGGKGKPTSGKSRKVIGNQVEPIRAGKETGAKRKAKCKVGAKSAPVTPNQQVDDAPVLATKAASAPTASIRIYNDNAIQIPSKPIGTPDPPPQLDPPPQPDPLPQPDATAHIQLNPAAAVDTPPKPIEAPVKAPPKSESQQVIATAPAKPVKIASEPQSISQPIS